MARALTRPADRRGPRRSRTRPLRRECGSEDEDRGELHAELGFRGPDERSNRRLGHLSAFLVEQPCPDPAGRVALLSGHGQVLGQPTPDGRRVRSKRWRGPRVCGPWRRQRGLESLVDRAPVDSVTAGKGTHGKPFLSMIVADTLEQLHPRQPFLPFAQMALVGLLRLGLKARGWGQIRSSLRA